MMKPIVIEIIAAVALAQWLVFALLSLFSRKAPPRGSARPSDKRLTISSLAFALGWLVAFGPPLLPNTKSAAHASASAMSTGAGSAHGSCASVETGMTGDAVIARVGQPDERRPNDDARGPGAVIWIYRDSRCAVHMMGDKVEAID